MSLATLCPSPPSPARERYLIVARDHAELIQLLREAIAARRELTVILDERRGERRRGYQPVREERRYSERRAHHTITRESRWWSYMLVRPHRRSPPN